MQVKNIKLNAMAGGKGVCLVSCMQLFFPRPDRSAVTSLESRYKMPPPF